MLEQSLLKPLYQDAAAWKIRKEFGKQFTYDNANGNPAIDKTVLEEFKSVSGNLIVWSRSDRLWRKRKSSDDPGRQQP
jgi:hypothetical protein